MTPIVPDSPHQNGELVIITGPGSEPLPASVDTTGLVMTEWEVSPEELLRLLVGARVRLWVYTGGQPLHPVLLEVVG